MAENLLLAATWAVGVALGLVGLYVAFVVLVGLVILALFAGAVFLDWCDALRRQAKRKALNKRD